MKYLKLSNKVFYVTLIFWFCETWYFGWNKVAMSEAERVCDDIVVWGFLLFLILFLTPFNVKYVKDIKAGKYEC